LIGLQEFHERFTGVALALEPTAAFQRQKVRRNLVWPYLRKLFTDRRLLWSAR
jgi:hypothetical protein